MFFVLGFTNARRNLGRSVMAVLGAAIAAMIMTSIISLSSGYPAEGWIESRTFLGADILVFSTKHLVGPDDLRPDKVQSVGGVPGQPARWSMASLPPDEVCDLMSLQPELYAQGFISPDGTGARPIDIESLQRTLSADSRITHVMPSFFLPIRLTYEYVQDRRLHQAELPQAALRGRDFAGQASAGLDFSRLLVGDSRCPTADEQHALVGLLDASLGLIGHQPPNPANPRLTIWVPAVSVGPDGRVTFDFLDETPYEIELVGQYATQTGSVSWQTPTGDYLHEDLFWITSQLQVPAGTFADIWADVTGGAPLQSAVQVGLRVDRLAYVEDIATQLRRILPEYSVVSVPQQMDLAHVRGLPEASFTAPLDMLGGADVPQTGLPVDLSQTFFVLVCLVAALLMATNLLFLVAERRKEIGILKAVGARGTDIALMILTEALTLNLLGTLLGFGLVRIFATWTMISNRIPISEIGRATATDFAVVMSAAALAAALFGMLPAWQMARLTSMEVLRND